MLRAIYLHGIVKGFLFFGLYKLGLLSTLHARQTYL